MNILQMPGKITALALADIFQRHVQGDMAGIGFGGSRHQYGGVAQGDPGFGHAQLQGHVHAGVDDGDDLGIGKAHILRRDDHEPAACGLHLPSFQKSGQVMAGGVRVGAADGFLQSGKQVIVVVAVPVGTHGAFLGDGFGIRQGQRQILPFRDACGEQHFYRVHGLAQIAAAGRRNVFQRTFFRERFQGGALFHEGHRPVHRLQGGRRGDLLEFENCGTAENGVEHVEIGIFCGGRDEGDLAVFDVFQQRLLLLLIEGLDLVQVQQNAVGGHEGIQLGHDLLDIGGGGCGGVQLIESTVGLLGDDIGNGSLARAAGTVKDHVGDLPGIDKPAQHRALAQDMLLSIDLIQRLGTQQVG